MIKGEVPEISEKLFTAPDLVPLPARARLK